LDFGLHIVSESHKKHSLLQSDAFKEIDLLFSQLNSDKKWLNLTNEERIFSSNLSLLAIDEQISQTRQSQQFF